MKLMPSIMGSRLSLWTKYQAFVHLTYYMIHPLMLVVVLLSISPFAVSGLAPSEIALALTSLVFALASVGPACMLVYAQLVLPARRWHRALWLPSILVIGVGVAWSTSLAVLSAFWSRDLHFVRTPKFGIGRGGGQWRGMRYGSGRPWGGLAELGLGLYCAWTAWVLGAHGHYGVLPFMLLYTAGFLTVGALTVLQAMPGLQGAVTARPSRRLIPSASPRHSKRRFAAAGRPPYRDGPSR
jgi:hypothetical protein